MNKTIFLEGESQTSNESDLLDLALPDYIFFFRVFPIFEAPQIFPFLIFPLLILLYVMKDLLLWNLIGHSFILQNILNKLIENIN